MEHGQYDHLFEADYEYDDAGDISEEVAKAVIVKYFDNMKSSRSDDEALQLAFNEIAEGDGLDVDQMAMVVSSIRELLENLKVSVTRMRVG